MPKNDRMKQWPDDRLLREASNGNDEAFQQFCVRALPGLLKYCQFHCKKMGVQADRAADFCQEAVHRALEHVRSCREPGGRPLPQVSVAWIKQIAFNCIIDWTRREQRVRLVGEFVGDLEAHTGPDMSLEESEEQEKLLKFFDWLPNCDRDILELVLLGELGIAEAGAQLGLSEDASYKAFQRALERLRDLLIEHGVAPQWADAG